MAKRSDRASNSKGSKLVPIGERVIIKPDPIKNEYTGDLHLPDAYKAFYDKLPDSGTVVSIGGMCKYNWPVGMKVKFGRLAGVRIEHNNEKYLIVNERDLLAIES